MLIYFRIVVISDDGSMMSVALNACVLALLDAGLPMFYVPNSVCFSVAQDKSIYLDPSTKEEESAIASLLFTLNPSTIKNTCAIVVSEFAYNGGNNSNSDYNAKFDALSEDFLLQTMDDAVKTSLALNDQIRRIVKSRLELSEPGGDQVWKK